MIMILKPKSITEGKLSKILLHWVAEADPQKGKLLLSELVTDMQKRNIDKTNMLFFLGVIPKNAQKNVRPFSLKKKELT